MQQLEITKLKSLFYNSKIHIFASSYYLQVLLAVKHNALGFDFPVFDVHLVATKNNGNVLTDTDQVTMPVRHVLIGDSRSDVEHDDSTLSC